MEIFLLLVGIVGLSITNCILCDEYEKKTGYSTVGVKVLTVFLVLAIVAGICMALSKEQIHGVELYINHPEWVHIDTVMVNGKLDRYIISIDPLLQ